jgi:hypothetical protein
MPLSDGFRELVEAIAVIHGELDRDTMLWYGYCVHSLWFLGISKNFNF